MARADRAARLTLFAAVAGWATGFSVLSIERHRAFETGRFDLGNMVQAVWSTAHGHVLQVTNLHGAQVSRLGAHVDPILIVFAPLWWLWPSPSLLLTAQAIVVAGLGIWYALGRRRWAAGGAIAATGIGATILAIDVVIPHFRHGAASSFFGRYDAVGGSAGGIVHKAFTDPGKLLSVAFDHRGAHYLLDLLLPIIVLAALAPLMLVALVPELALNLLSSVDAQKSIHFHYVAGEIPILFAAAAIGLGRLGRWAGMAGTAAVLATLVANYALGPIPLWRFVPGGATFQAKSAHVSRHDRIAARELGLIPAEAVVSATNSLGAHLSARRRVFSFPHLRGAQWVAVDERRPSLGDHYDQKGGLERIEQFRRDKRFRLVSAADGVLVFKER